MSPVHSLFVCFDCTLKMTLVKEHLLHRHTVCTVQTCTKMRRRELRNLHGIAHKNGHLVSIAIILYFVKTRCVLLDTVVYYEELFETFDKYERHELTLFEMAFSINSGFKDFMTAIFWPVRQFQHAPIAQFSYSSQHCLLLLLLRISQSRFCTSTNYEYIS